MKLRTTALAALALAAFAAPSLAETFVKGVVQKVDTKTQKLTIAHEDLVDLDMPAMTMVFTAGEASMLENLKEGDRIEFVAERINGRLTVTKVKSTACDRRVGVLLVVLEECRRSGGYRYRGSHRF